MARPYKTGVIHGRFQVLHNDHVNYIMAGKALCHHLIIGITNPDPGLTRQEGADPNRSLESANPLTYFERYACIKAVMAANQVDPADFSIVPFPINFPDLYRYYTPEDAVYFVTIYDEWGKEKLSKFEKMGFATHVLWEVPPEKKGISAQTVRSNMMSGTPWEELVPDCIVKLMHEWRIPDRLRDGK